jgi:hypothetical protein
VDFATDFVADSMPRFQSLEYFTEFALRLGLRKVQFQAGIL